MSDEIATVAVGDVIEASVWAGPRPAKRRECVVKYLTIYGTAIGSFRTNVGRWSVTDRVLQRPWLPIREPRPVRWTLNDYRRFCQQLRDDYATEPNPERRARLKVILDDVRRMVGWPSGATL